MKKLSAFLIVGALGSVAAISSFSLASDLNPQSYWLNGKDNTSVVTETNSKPVSTQTSNRKLNEKKIQKIEIKSYDEIVSDLEDSVNYDSLPKDQQEDLSNVIQEYAKKISEIIKDFSTDTEDLTQDVINAKYQKTLNKYVKKLQAYKADLSVTRTPPKEDIRKK